MRAGERLKEIFFTLFVSSRLAVTFLNFLFHGGRALLPLLSCFFRDKSASHFSKPENFLAKI